MKENQFLLQQLEDAYRQLHSLRDHVGEVRQQTVAFILQQMETLHIQKDTHVWHTSEWITVTPFQLYMQKLFAPVVFMYLIYIQEHTLQLSETDTLLKFYQTVFNRYIKHNIDLSLSVVHVNI